MMSHLLLLNVNADYPLIYLLIVFTFDVVYTKYLNLNKLDAIFFIKNQETMKFIYILYRNALSFLIINLIY